MRRGIGFQKVPAAHKGFHTDGLICTDLAAHDLVIAQYVGYLLAKPDEPPARKIALHID